MKKYVAILHKEYMETRAQTLVLLLLGIIIPLLDYLFGGRARPFAYLLGGTIFVVLNASILCATTFARERENGSLETLSRVVHDWRVASIAKFGYALLSTFILGFLFLGATFVDDHIQGLKHTTTLVRALNSDESVALGMILKGSGLTFTFCWGIFWTGRTKKQAKAIFLAFFSAIFCGVVSTALCRLFFPSSWENASCALWLILSIIATVVAPLHGRFGYLNVDYPQDVHNSDVPQNTPQTNCRLVSAPKGNARLGEHRPFPLSALLRHILAESAFLFQSPASLLFETAILVVTIGVLKLVANSEPASHGYAAFFSVGRLSFALIAVYAVARGSGLFQGAKRNGDPLKERFNIPIGVYWLANALAALTFALVLSLGTALLCDSLALRSFVSQPHVVALFIGSTLWGATLRKGRLETVAITLLFLFLALLEVYLIAKTPSSTILERFGTPGAKSFCYLVAGVLATISFLAVDRRMKGKKIGVIPIMPALLLLTTLVAIPLNQSSKTMKTLPARLPVNPAYATLFEKLGTKIKDQGRSPKSLEEFVKPSITLE